MTQEQKTIFNQWLFFCEVCGKEVKGKSIGERTEYPIHEMTRFVFCSECKKKIRQDITDDLLQYERQKVIEWVRKKKDKVKSYILRG